MSIDFLLKIFEKNIRKEAIICGGKIYNYNWILMSIYSWLDFLKYRGIEQGTVVVIESDFSPKSSTLFLALIYHKCIVVPLTSSVEAKKSEFIRIAQGEVSFKIGKSDEVNISFLSSIKLTPESHKLYQELRKRSSPGLVLFSSGSSGEPKAAVHDMSKMLEKYKVKRTSLKTIPFMLFDHIGGINTMLYTLSNTGCMVIVNDRSPDTVLRAIEKYKIELLPTSPTFINLILLSKAYKHYDISSLKRVTYGTEPMPESTLKRFHKEFPTIKLQQTYGLSELGILRSKSKSSDSLWMKIGGEGFQTRVVKGILQIKADSTMLGYLNAPSPFTSDGWFDTGDCVEVDGEYIKILGRKSEIINVGGLKVHPSEVESIIQEVSNIKEVTVYGEKNAIIGNIVCAKISLVEVESNTELIIKVKKHCLEKLENYKVPIKIFITDSKQHSERFKKIRRE